MSPSLWDMTVGVRPEDVQVSGEPGEGCVRGTLTNRIKLPVKQTTILNVRVGEHEVVAQMAGEEYLTINAEVWLCFRKYHLFDKNSGLRVGSMPAFR